MIGVLSAISLIFNGVMGTGYACLHSGMSCVDHIYRVFAGTSIILNSSGSVGMTFVMWILGALVAAAGTAVYIELGTVTFSFLHYHHSP
jgi:hypothetical protein